VPSIYGTFASLMVIPPERRATGAFCDLLEALLALAATFEQVARPIPAGSLRLRSPPTGLDLMARMRHKSGHLLLMDRIYVGMRTLTAYASLRFGLSIRQVPAEDVSQRSDRELGFQEILRPPAHDTRLFGGGRRSHRGADCGRRATRGRALASTANRTRS